MGCDDVYLTPEDTRRTFGCMYGRQPDCDGSCTYCKSRRKPLDELTMNTRSDIASLLTKNDGHSIELVLDVDGVRATFECHADPTGWCREVCAAHCPVWTDECLEDHGRELVDYCNPLEFAENQGMWHESYIGEETEPRSGAIIFEWQADEWYGWKYAEENQ